MIILARKVFSRRALLCVLCMMAALVAVLDFSRVSLRAPIHLSAPIVQSITLATATLASEDLTCITAGELVQHGHIHWITALGGCILGIYAGDMLLWFAGRTLGRGIVRLPWFARRISPGALDHCASWFEQRGVAAIFAARFLPGTRLPLYIAAGTLGRKQWQFAFWSFIAALIWTPLIVLLAALLGQTFIQPFRSVSGLGWLALAITILITFTLLRLAASAATEIGRYRICAAFARLWRWEFWPAWLFYLPLIPWIFYLSIRHRGFTAITAANPGIPLGGFVGESKFQILESLDPSYVIPTVFLEPAEASVRVHRLRKLIVERDWAFPLILKPDVGERGAGVKRADSLDDAERYFIANQFAVIVQPYHPGPYEAGIFYYRFPNEPAGRIFSITDKIFSDVIGDGVSTLEQLIYRHPRYRMQARAFRARHSDIWGCVLPEGERLRLAIAGNHCQGTMFRDGSGLLTPELERKIDEIAKRFAGFCFGRFDIRYGDIKRFKAGEDLTIIELNGVTSESTNIYDPSRSLWSAYGTLVRQWRILFRIGAANRHDGHKPATCAQLLCATLSHARTPRSDALSD